MKITEVEVSVSRRGEIAANHKIEPLQIAEIKYLLITDIEFQQGAEVEFLQNFLKGWQKNSQKLKCIHLMLTFHFFSR